ncbi:polysaccharide lyase family 7 protein [Pseudomonas sp. SG20056]|uniref:polysaccharide lyase family 7 protein n=1 Tax=Pseudomonas sp. SG20056 TaxID=3074146 RepID=UPI00287F58FA|nr:polysaccharide lyase family 7 protein [Pseudomonas sp. SG20056]WNF48684.1 polysaccharide lyase family 7 protein [Pseudomonas sp. SG20056]
MFDLTTWNLSVPSAPAPSTISTARLNNGYSSQYFRRNADDSVTFWVAVNGSRTTDARLKLLLRKRPGDEEVENIRWRKTSGWASASAMICASAPAACWQLVSACRWRQWRPA